MNYERFILPVDSRIIDRNLDFWPLANLFMCSDLISAVTTLCLERVLSFEGSSGLAAVDRLLLSLIFHSSKVEDNAIAMKDLQNAFDRA